MIKTNTVIVGASAAGLAAAACLQKQNVDYIILEKQKQVAQLWRNHYDRLHLHTNKKLSNLPFQKFDKNLPTYPPRDAVVDYLDQYAKNQNINPVFETEVFDILREGEYWITTTKKGEKYQSKNVIMATGSTNAPKKATFNGLKTFPGKIIHSSEYKNGEEFKGQKVLVVGFGNSACEQAICLHEHGAFPSLSVRSTVNVLPRDLLGIPILQLGLLTAPLPPRLADTLNASLINFIIGDITKLGLKKSKYGPLEQIQKEKRIPLLDIGTIKLMREGHIKAFGDIKKVEGNLVTFEDNRTENFDAILLATGYVSNLEKFLPENTDRIADLNTKINKQNNFGKDGLYFCGFYISPTGMLREIGIEAKAIANDISKKNIA
ncbi:NAD(P)/FAD-dependent oxidoreductase [Lacihabitans sp. LS3-19]|uniref:flavin-containing monooxygenase n=1 Tax=Lacihabitans sp. LS3-19 TaxID=2487335 RepID=UPI0020CF0596|nr:NAD(P)/FAD-dependent oxidoreductase [Lacihabitans sp. LS3-19]MCP9769036.1 NAD(P)/FAD-dependent oxidoreductase [Lacihabitans sp. LS3-19]